MGKFHNVVKYIKAHSVRRQRFQAFLNVIMEQQRQEREGLERERLERQQLEASAGYIDVELQGRWYYSVTSTKTKPY